MDEKFVGRDDVRDEARRDGVGKRHGLVLQRDDVGLEDDLEAVGREEYGGLALRTFPDHGETGFIDRHATRPLW